MQHTVCIVQARLRSTRLPGKTMLMLPTLRTVIQEVVWRAQQIKGIAMVVVAMPDSPDSNIIDFNIEKMLTGFPTPIALYRGPECDVLKRYAEAAEGTNANRVMRITSDCPLLDPATCGGVLKMMDEGYDYVSNVHPRTFPVGWDCECFTRAALDWANGNKQLDTETREHVTGAIYTSPELFKIGNMAQAQDQSHIRWTLDTIDDYVTICQEFQRRIGDESNAR